MFRKNTTDTHPPGPTRRRGRSESLAGSACRREYRATCVCLFLSPDGQAPPLPDGGLYNCAGATVHSRHRRAAADLPRALRPLVPLFVNLLERHAACPYRHLLDATCPVPAPSDRQRALGSLPVRDLVRAFTRDEDVCSPSLIPLAFYASAPQHSVVSPPIFSHHSLSLILPFSSLFFPLLLPPPNVPHHR